MKGDLLEIPTEKLLEKFGAGDHKPGSGSAAAFQGMISAKLIVTVISLTNVEKRRKSYSEFLPDLLFMEKNIRERIFPELKELFNQDSIQFDKTIKSREKRNDEKDLFKKNKLNRNALAELEISIDIPIKIANLCIELADISKYVFENGFQAARGDSQVALSGAVAALGGCISIIQLNLLSFGGEDHEYTERIYAQAKKLRERHHALNLISNLKIDVLEQEFHEKTLLNKKITSIISPIKSKKNITDFEIEEAAIQIQNLIWKNRNSIWKKNCPSHPIQALKANMVLKKALDYEFFNNGKIDLDDGKDEQFTIAGVIDQKNKLVLISNTFSKQIQNFTAAHELGHAVLHNQPILHRDRPIDINNKTRRSIDEIQADKFATYFLMPKKQVVNMFREIFLEEYFEINELTKFRLTRDSNTDIRKEAKNLRGLSRKLAETESYDSVSFKSIAELFGVSVEAMAIRLEELDLVRF